MCCMTICLALLIAGCEYTKEPPEDSDAIQEGTFVLGKSNYNSNKLLIGNDMQVSIGELQEALKQSAAELIREQNYQLYWLDLSNLPEDIYDTIAVGSKIRYTLLYNEHLDTIPPTVFAKDISIID